MPILPPLPRPQRRRIHKIIHATRDKGHAHRLMAILLLHEGRTITTLMFITLPARLARPSAVGFGGIEMKVWGRRC
jgi:hypothetical protein